MKIVKSSILILFLLQLLSGCIIIKHDSDSNVEYQPLVLSPKPEIPMSDILVRSDRGDMIAFLPKDWFFIDLEDKASSEIFAVAVNPDYTLSLVFSLKKANARNDQIIEQEGLLGLARICFEKRQKKTAAAVKAVGKPYKIKFGNLEFVVYEFSSTGGAIRSKAAVFISSIGQSYEVAIVPMDFRGRPIPDKDEINKIFNSVLATVQY